jgi:hypothetical protein
MVAPCSSRAPLAGRVCDGRPRVRPRRVDLPGATDAATPPSTAPLSTRPLPLGLADATDSAPDSVATVAADRQRPPATDSAAGPRLPLPRRGHDARLGRRPARHRERGEVSYVEGRFGQGFSINGPRNYVTIPATVGDFDGDFTIALWFKTRYWGEMLGRRAGCWNVPSYTGEDLDLSSEGYRRRRGVHLRPWVLHGALPGGLQRRRLAPRRDRAPRRHARPRRRRHRRRRRTP